MASRNLECRVLERLQVHGVPPPAAVAALVQYLDLLARWNRRINLTAFNLDDLADEAIDRLIVEPTAAARHVLAGDRIAVDVGSGGGSPALPLKIAVPRLRMTLIEARARKSAFLREAIRVLGLTDMHVETCRLESAGLPRLNGRADVVTLRAVRADEELWAGITALARPGGRVFWFTGHCTEGSFEVPDTWARGGQSAVPLLTVLTRT